MVPSDAAEAATPAENEGDPPDLRQWGAALSLSTPISFIFGDRGAGELADAVIEISDLSDARPTMTVFVDDDVVSSGRIVDKARHR